MTNEISPPIPPPLPPAAAPSRGRRRGFLAGVAVSALAIVGLVGAVTFVGAQESDDPPADPAPVETTEAAAETSEESDSDEDFQAFDDCLTEQLGDLDADRQWEAAEAACENLLPEDIKAETLAFRPFEECIDTEIGEEPDFEADLTDADWEAFDQAFADAEAACKGLLPADALAEYEAFEAFEQCLSDNGAGFDDHDMGNGVFIEGEPFSQVVFGDEPGTVTITGTASGNLDVSVSGGATLLDESALEAQWEAEEAAYSSCENLLPESAHMFDEFDESDLFDESDESDESDLEN